MEENNGVTVYNADSKEQKKTRRGLEKEKAGAESRLKTPTYLGKKNP